MLRKLMAQHIWTIRRVNFERFHLEQAKVRRDFDKIFNGADESEVNLMLEKYEMYIEKYFEPYAAMHECRQHSNLWGKMVPWGDKALETDHFGYYKQVPVNVAPTAGNFHEEYPHMVTAWIYDHQYLDADFNYDNLEKDYLAGSQMAADANAAKQQLDDAHKH